MTIITAKAPFERLESRVAVDHFGCGLYTLTASTNEEGHTLYSILKHAKHWHLPNLKLSRRGTKWTITIELDQLTMRTPEQAADLAAGLDKAVEAQNYFYRIVNGSKS